MYLLWGAVFSGKTSIGGFTFDQTLTYFVVIFIMQFFVGAFNEDYQISEDIRNGLINQFLLKPINYFAYRLSVFAAARVVSGAISALMALLVALPLLWSHLVPSPRGMADPGRPRPSGDGADQRHPVQHRLLFRPPRLLVSSEAQGFVILSMAVETLLGGQIFPLDLLPHSVFNVARFLPFFYQAYFPAAVLTGRQGIDFAVQGLAIQAVWAFLLVCLAEAVWRRGLRHHTAAGG